MTIAPAAGVRDTVAVLPAVTLDELNEQASLLTRVDRKYLVPANELVDVLASLHNPVRVLTVADQRSFGYETIYFDTASLTAYWDAARRRPARWKVRIRSYVDSGDEWLEVKIRDRGGKTVKHRSRREVIGHEFAGHERFFVGRWVPEPTALRPTLRTGYDRVTLLDATTASRTTIDLALRCHSADGRGVDMPSTAVVETKTAGPPSAVDRALWANGHRPTRFSKYCTALAALTDLRANRWHRTLQRTPFRRRPSDLDQES